MALSREYKQYINSPAWRIRRDKILTRDGRRCRICGGWAQQVHHSRYIHLGHELDNELISVCKSCHIVVTWWIRIRRLMKW